MLPAVAQAHVGVETAELLAGGIHPWINPDSALVLAGCRCGWRRIPTATEIRPFIVLGFALAAGVASWTGFHPGSPMWLPWILTLSVGLCLGAQWQPGLPTLLLSVGCAALAAGYYAGADAAADIKSPLAFVAGSLAGALVFPLAITMLLGERRSRVLHIGIRVVGSWLAAIGLMLLALRLRGP